MTNVDDDTVGAEHPGFLQKIKDKLHIGHHHKDKEATTATSPGATDTAVSSKSISTADDTPANAPPSTVESAPPVEHKPHHPTVDLSKLVGHEDEHHGGTPTFLVALPDQDIPEEVTKETATSDAQGGEFFDSEEVFSKAQEGEHHEGVPTFLVALPDEDMPDEGVKKTLHHVTAGQILEDAPLSSDKEVSSDFVGKGAEDSGVKQEFDSEEVFSKAQQGEHHEGVPTFLVALPDQDLPGEETKEKLHHVSGGQTGDA